jgi:hypothetical protein
VDSLKALDPEWPIREEKRTLLGPVDTAETCEHQTSQLIFKALGAGL